MPINNSDIFKCDLHDFSTSDIEKYDKHCAELEHEYDLHTPCANLCGHQIHILPKQKLDPAARRIPRGYLCDDCKKKVKDAKAILEPGEKEKKNES